MDGSGGVRRGARGAAEEPLSNVTGPVGGNCHACGPLQNSATDIHALMELRAVIERPKHERTVDGFCFACALDDDPVRWSGTGFPGHEASSTEAADLKMDKRQ